MRHPSPESYLNNFLGSVADCLDAFTAALFVFEPETKKLRLRAFHSLSDAVIDGAVVEEGRGFLGWVMRHQRCIQVPRFKRDSRTLGFYCRDAGLKSFLAVPLPGEAGVLCVDSRARFAFSAKHERILQSLAAAALKLLNAERAERLQGFYSEVMKWQMASHDNRKESLIGLLKILSLDTAIVARHVVNTSFIVVEDVFQNDNTGCAAKEIRGEKVSLGQGMAGWIIRHKSNILLTRRRKESAGGFLLKPGEPFSSGPVIVGVFCPYTRKGLGVNYCFLFSGDACASFWPAELLEILEFLLKGLVPWH